MKKILNLVIVILIITSCQKQKVKLELNLIKNETYLQKFNSDMMITETVNGQPMDIKMTIGGTMSYKVINILDSIYNMDVTYKVLFLKMNLQGRDIEYSSEKKDTNDIFSNILGLLKDKSINMNISKAGRIKDLKGIDSLFSGIFEMFPNLPEDKKQQIKEQMKQSFGEKSFKGNLQMTTSIFPETTVSIGDKWKINSVLESTMKANLETTYELKDIKDSCYIITGTSTLNTNKNGKDFEMSDMKIKYDFNGTIVSELKIDKKTGWIIEGKVNQEMSGNAKVVDSEKTPGGMNIPMKMKNVMTFTR